MGFPWTRGAVPAAPSGDTGKGREGNTRGDGIRNWRGTATQEGRPDDGPPIQRNVARGRYLQGHIQGQLMPTRYATPGRAPGAVELPVLVCDEKTGHLLASRGPFCYGNVSAGQNRVLTAVLVCLELPFSLSDGEHAHS